MIDSYNREITCLRISVTDHCNLRCVYCSPEKPEYVAGKSLLSPTEIRKIVEIAVEKGVDTIRITGGEPLMRTDLDQIIGEINEIQGVRDIGITTNGILLEKYAFRLAQVGLKRVNISLDTLDKEKFRKITRSGNFSKTWNGILAAEAVKLNPIKINSVIIRGVNDNELESLAALTIHKPWHIRFIEFMPLVGSSEAENLRGSHKSNYVSMNEMIDRLSSLNIIPAEKIPGTCPVVTYQIPGAKGTIGFIAPIGKKFCSECNRLRLTADGFIRTCLLDGKEIYIRDSLRSKEEIVSKIELALRIKPEGHHLEQGIFPGMRHMRQIGG